VELMIALVLLALVSGTIGTVIVRQQSFYSGVADMIRMRSQLRDVANILPTDLRGISTAGGDIYAMTDSSVDFRLTFGSAVVCTIDGTRTVLTVPPPLLGTRSGVTSWLAVPQRGDSLFIYDEGATSATTDDSWKPYVLTAAPAAGASCPIANGFTKTASEASAGYTLAVTPALPTTTPQGSVIRFYRRALPPDWKPIADAGSPDQHLALRRGRAYLDIFAANSVVQRRRGTLAPVRHSGRPRDITGARQSAIRPPEGGERSALAPTCRYRRDVSLTHPPVDHRHLGCADRRASGAGRHAGRRLRLWAAARGRLRRRHGRCGRPRSPQRATVLTPAAEGGTAVCDGQDLATHAPAWSRPPRTPSRTLRKDRQSGSTSSRSVTSLATASDVLIENQKLAPGRRREFERPPWDGRRGQ
jgi:hypothetical protein